MLNFTTLLSSKTTGAQIGTVFQGQNTTLGRNGNTCSGSGGFRSYDATGAAVFSDSFTITGKRIVAGAALPAHL